MKTKIIIFAALVLVILSCLFIGGCSDSPEEVAQKWYEAINNCDLETANEHTVNALHDDNCELIYKLLSDKDWRNEYRAVITTALNEEAKIDTNGNYAEIDGEIYLIKEDGEWKIISFMD